MRPGEIRIEDVSRSFRVYPREGRTLKESAVELGYVTEAEYDELVRPERMV